MSATGSVQPYSTGAAYLYAAFGIKNRSAPKFFGTCEGYPKHERRPDYMQLLNDVTGRRKPMDMSFQGLDATIALDVTVWDEGVYQDIVATAELALGTDNEPGFYNFSDVGTLMGFEDAAAQIWIAYGNRNGPFAKAAYSALPAGYHYWQCIPFQSDTTEEGAQPMIRSLQLYAWPWCNFQTGENILYDEDMSAIVGIPLNGPVAA